MRVIYGLAISALLCANIAFSATLRDPTAPFGAGQTQSRAQSGPLQASAIIYSPNRKLAFLNGHYYSVGQKINDSVITQIDRHRIILETDNNTVVVKVPASQPVKHIHEERT